MQMLVLLKRQKYGGMDQEESPAISGAI